MTAGPTAPAGWTPRDSPVDALVARASAGEPRAWDELVDRYAPLVWSICHRYRLRRPDLDDAAQAVWLRLVEHLPTLRDPAALPGWLATTTHRECLRVLRGGRRLAHREVPLADQVSDGYAAEDPYSTVDQKLVEAQRNAALREAYRQLSERCQRLLAVLLRDPPPSYAAVSAELGMPVGSIGPSRGRCLDSLRRSPVLAGVLADAAGREVPGRPSTWDSAGRTGSGRVSRPEDAGGVR